MNSLASRLAPVELNPQQRIAYGCAGTVGMVAVAELLVRSGLVHVAGVPAPSEVLAQAARLVVDATFQTGILQTLDAWAFGMLIAIVLGVALGALMGSSRTMDRLAQLTVELIRPLPSVAIGPLLVLILGPGLLPEAWTVAFAAVWPILFNTMYGFRAVDRVAVETARGYRLKPWQIALRVKLPSAAPFAMTGIRVSAAIAMIVAISVEIVIGNGRGIGGYVLLVSAGGADLNAVYGATLIGGILGLATILAFEGLDRVTLPWKRGLAQ